MMIHIGQQPSLTEVLHAQYVQKINQSIEAYSVFLSLNLLKDAHQTLSNIFELQTLFQLLYGLPLGNHSLEELQNILRGIEKEAGIPTFESAVRPAYEGMMKRLDEPSFKLMDIPENQLNAFAVRYLQMIELPPDRLPYLLADMHAQRLFEHECENETIEMLVHNQHLTDKATAYAGPLSYMLRDKVSGFISPPSQDMKKLLEAFRGIIKKP